MDPIDKNNAAKYLQSIGDLRSLGPLTHSHTGIPDNGKRYLHKHICEICGFIFVHAHTQKGQAVSRKYGPHLCQACR